MLNKTSELRNPEDVPKLLFERLKNVIDDEEKEDEDTVPDD